MRRRLTAIIAAISLLAVGIAAGAATTARFSDVPEDHWAAEAIEWATGNGIMRERGDGTVFEPGKPVTRAKLAQILYRYDQHLSSDNLTIAESTDFYDIFTSYDAEGVRYGTSLGFDLSHTYEEVIVLIRDLCETLGNTPANASLRETQNVIPNWIEATTWGQATDYDKWRVIAWGQRALCLEYESIYEAWADAGWSPLDFG